MDKNFTFTLTVRDTHLYYPDPWRVKGYLPCGTLINIFVDPDDRDFREDPIFLSKIPKSTVYLDAQGVPFEPQKMRDLLKDGCGLRLPCGAQGRFVHL